MNMIRTALTPLVAVTIAAAAATGAQAESSGPLQGDWLVPHAVNQPAPVHIEMTTAQDGQTTASTLECVLPNGEDSQFIACPSISLTLPVTAVGGTQYQTLLTADFLDLAVWADHNGQNLIEAEPVEVLVLAAEAKWDWWNGKWVCETDDADVAKCVEQCGGPGEVSATPHPASNNPFAEPSCKVECECTQSDDDYEWIDPPQVEPM